MMQQIVARQADVPSPRDRLAERVAAAIVTHRQVTAGPEWLPLAEAARQLGCSPAAVRMRVSRGRLEARRHGRRLYVSRRSLQELRP